jgi:hypothetical protein
MAPHGTLPATAYLQVSPAITPPPRGGAFELCYNVRYFDKNNRPNTKAVWSERQVAIYHRFNVAKFTSSWIIVQASANMKSQLRNYLAAIPNGNTLNDQITPHLLFLLELESNWQAYIDFLEAQITETVSCHVTQNIS